MTEQPYLFFPYLFTRVSMWSCRTAARQTIVERLRQG